MIQRILTILLLTLCVVRGSDAPASEKSVKELLAITEVRKLIDGMIPQMEAVMRQAADASISSRQLSAGDKKVAEKMQTIMSETLCTELAWDRWEPIYVKICCDTFPQKEMDGLLAFYKTPAGAAVIKKMPTVLRSSLTEVQTASRPRQSGYRKKSMTLWTRFKLRKTPP